MRTADTVVIDNTKNISTERGSFWVTILTALGSAITALILGGVFFGGAFSRLEAVEVKAKETDQKMENKLDDIQKRMVDKDDFKELRKDFQDFTRKK